MAGRDVELQKMIFWKSWFWSWCTPTLSTFNIVFYFQSCLGGKLFFKFASIYLLIFYPLHRTCLLAWPSPSTHASCGGSLAPTALQWGTQRVTTTSEAMASLWLPEWRWVWFGYLFCLLLLFWFELMGMRCDPAAGRRKRHGSMCPSFGDARARLLDLV